MTEKIKTNVINQLIYFGFFVVLFCLCVLYNINLLRWKELGVFATILVLFVFWIIKLVEEKEFVLVRTPLDYPVLIYLFYCFISFLFAFSKSAAWTNLYQSLLYVILFFITVNTVKEQKDIDWLIKFLVFISFFVGIYGLLQYFGYDFTQWENMERIFSTFGNAILFAAYIIFIFPLVVNNLFQEKNKATIYFSSIILIILFTDLIFTESRGGWIGFVVMVIIFFVLHIRYGFLKDKKIDWDKFIALMLAVSIVIAGITLWKWDVLYKIISRPTARLYLWEGAIKMAISRFLFGHGIGSFPLVFPYFRPPAVLEMHPVSKTFVRHAHNEFLEIWAELGTVGLILFLIVLWMIFYLGLALLKRTKEQEPRYLTIALLSGIAGDLVFNLTSVDLRFISSATLFWLYSAFIAVMYNMYCQEEKVYSGLAKTFKEDVQPNVPYILLRIIVYIPLILFVFLMIKTLTKPFEAMFVLPKMERFFTKSPEMEDEIGRLEEAVKKDTTQAILYYKLGTLYAKKEDWENALKNLDKSVMLDNNNPGPLNNIGNIYFTIGRLDIAVKAYQEAIRVEPNHVDSHFNLAFAYFKMGMLNEAVKELDIVLKLDPNNPKALKVREMIIQ